MSMYASCTLPGGGVVFITDGRRFDVLSGRPVQDDNEKIVKIGESVIATGLGIDPVIDRIQERLSAADIDDMTGEQVDTLLVRVVREEWAAFTDANDTSAYREDAGVHVSVGGLDVNGDGFFARAGEHANWPEPQHEFDSDPRGGWVHSAGVGTTTTYSELFDKVRTAFLETPYQTHIIPLNATILRFIEIAAVAIRARAAECNLTGGRICVGVVRPDCGVVLGHIDPTQPQVLGTARFEPGTIIANVVRTGSGNPRMQMEVAGDYSHHLLGYDPSGVLRLNISSSGPIYGTDIYGSKLLNALLDPTVSGRSVYMMSQVYSAAAPTSWTNLDLSAHVGKRRALVWLRVYNDATGNRNFNFRSSDTAVDQEITADTHPGVFSTRVAAKGYNYVQAVTNTSGVCQWRSDGTNTTTIVIMFSAH